MTNEWTRADHVLNYLQRMKDIPHRQEGEATLLSEIPSDATRVLDLGCGNGHLLALLLAHCTAATGVALDLSPTMLEQARDRFSGNERVTLVEHNMDQPLPELGAFDVVASSFAIHHCTHERKRALYAEVWSLLEPGGVFCNLEHVSSPTERIHERFVQAMGMTPADEDPSNKLLDVETQLQWLREIGFSDVDCFWKWRELALIAGRKPVDTSSLPPAGHQLSDEPIQKLDVSPSSGSANDRPVLCEAPAAEEIAFLDDQLDDFNRQRTGRDDFQPLWLVFHNASGDVIAGLKGLTGWDWLHIQVLWVHADFRRNGLGSRLLAKAEQEARDRGCLGACLSSYTFQAPEFYKHHGYTVFGQIDEYPHGETMFFLSKQLAKREG